MSWGHHSPTTRNKCLLHSGIHCHMQKLYNHTALIIARWQEFLRLTVKQMNLLCATHRNHITMPKDFCLEEVESSKALAHGRKHPTWFSRYQLSPPQRNCNYERGWKVVKLWLPYQNMPTCLLRNQSLPDLRDPWQMLYMCGEDVALELRWVE